MKNRAYNQRKDFDYKLQKKEKSLKNKLSKLEAKIATLEKKIKGIDLELESQQKLIFQGFLPQEMFKIKSTDKQ